MLLTPLEHAGEGLGGELAGLIGVEYLRSAAALGGPRRTRYLAYSNPPCQHFARIPVNHRYQVHKSPRQAKIGDVGTPHLVGCVTSTPRSRYG